MRNIFSTMQRELSQGHDVMLITIIAEGGSTPRGTGAQMLIGENGQLCGTIGGGNAELLCTDLGMQLLLQKRSATHTYRLRKNNTEDIDAVCGGDFDVLLQYISADDTLWNTLCHKLLDCFSTKTPAYLMLRFDGGAPSLMDANSAALCGETVDLNSTAHFVMALPIGERAIIFGAGHCALALAPLLKTVGFRVTVFDERDAFANTERYPGAESVICGDYQDIRRNITVTDEDFVVVMTSGHIHDFEVEEQILRGKFAYLGVIGSRAKTASVNQQLRECGISDEQIAKVHAPIGTAIKAVTPEEIAVSIAGEMIYERALRREADGVVRHGCPMH